MVSRKSRYWVADKSAYDVVYMFAAAGREVEWIVRKSGKGPAWVFPAYANLGPFKAVREVHIPAHISTAEPCSRLKWIETRREKNHIFLQSLHLRRKRWIFLDPKFFTLHQTRKIHNKEVLVKAPLNYTRRVRVCEA